MVKFLSCKKLRFKRSSGQASIISLMIILLVTVGLAATVLVWGASLVSGGQKGFQFALTVSSQRVSEELTIEGVKFLPETVIVYVKNTGSAEATLSTLYLNGETFTLTPQTLSPGETATLTLDYSWSAGETYHLTLTTTRGKTFEVYVEAPKVSSGWLEGWQYRKSHEIEGSTAGSLTDYQVKIIVHYGSGTDSGENVYLNSHSLTDFGDVRFTAADGLTTLPYWMESKVDGDYAIFWVKIPRIPESPGKATIYIYYGNSSASDASNGDSTFEFFDDFTGDSLNTSKWNVVANEGTITVEERVLKLSRPAGGKLQHLESKKSFSGHLSIRFRMKLLQSNFYYCSVYYGSLPNVSSIGYSLWSGYESALYTGNSYYPPRCGTGTSTLGDVITDPPTPNQWFIEEFLVKNGKLTRLLNDSLQEAATRYDGVSSGKIGLYAISASSQAMEHHVDYIFARKLVEPEPSHGSWGAEETA